MPSFIMYPYLDTKSGPRFGGLMMKTSKEITSWSAEDIEDHEWTNPVGKVPMVNDDNGFAK